MNTLVSFELAKLLKEKGFNKETERVYGQIFKDTYGLVPFSFTEMDEESGFKDADYFLAPTVAQVIMWLYEKHEIWITDFLFYKGKHNALIYKNIGYGLELSSIKNNLHGPYNSPTEAYEAAIKYTLQNLI